MSNGIIPFPMKPNGSIMTYIDDSVTLTKSVTIPIPRELYYSESPYFRMEIVGDCSTAVTWAMLFAVSPSKEADGWFGVEKNGDSTGQVIFANNGLSRSTSINVPLAPKHTFLLDATGLTIDGNFYAKDGSVVLNNAKCTGFSLGRLSSYNKVKFLVGNEVLLDIHAASIGSRNILYDRVSRRIIE